MYTPFLHSNVFSVPRSNKGERGHLLNLSSNELLHPALSQLLEQPLNMVTPALAWTYPAYASTIATLAAYYQVDPASLLISAGSDDAIRLVIEALATSVGSMVLQVPNYEGWRRHANLRGVQVREIAFGLDIADRFTVDQFRSVLSGSTPTLVAISNPNGPTGFAFADHEMAELSKICQDNGHILVIDLCYRRFNDRDNMEPAENEILIETFSKSWGLAGVRIASVIAHPTIADYLLRFRPENAVSGIALHLASAVLQRDEEMSRIRTDVVQSLPVLIDKMRRIRPTWAALPTRANFVNFRTGSNDEVAATVAALEAHGVRVRNATSETGLDGCIRVSLAEWTILARFCNALDQVPRF